MNTMLIRQARRLQVIANLSHCRYQPYAFVGLGEHSLVNLYPVLSLLHVPLKYICVTSPGKAERIRRHFVSSPTGIGTVVTTSLHQVLSDPAVAGVFVSATPSAHFSLACEVMEHRKALFIEKPPCRSLGQLQELAARQAQTGGIVQVGMQKRSAPAVCRLKKRLRFDTVYNYSLRYCVGRYPEGDALTELFLHPLDMALHLFGDAKVAAIQPAGDQTIIVMLLHNKVVGTVELSTGYSWATPIEEMTVHTRAGVYSMPSIDTLYFHPNGVALVGIPVEKIFHPHVGVEVLCRHDGFTPVMSASHWVEHGFYHELKAFVDTVEGRRHPTLTSFQSLIPTYGLLNDLSRVAAIP